jgi:hypothetical protein
VRVRGLTELVRSFKHMPDELVDEFVSELEEAANPVMLAAQAKAPTVMSGMGRPTESNRAWSMMRVGIARRNPANVYVVPQLRRGVRKQSQKQKDKFAEHMQTRALEPALKENEEKIRERIDNLLDTIGRKQGF